MFRARIRGAAAPTARARARADVGAFMTACALLTAAASAAGVARADGDDHTFAQHVVDELERAKSPATAEAIQKAKDALERATRFRASGDEAHAKAADGLAREWAETGRDLGLAAAAEEQASDTRRKAIEAQAKLERTRALVEEGVARVGRMRAELEAATARPGTAAVETHDGQAPKRAPATKTATAGGASPASPSPAAPKTPVGAGGTP